MSDELTAQIADELARLAGALGSVLGDMDLTMERRAQQAAPMLAAQLLQEDDDRLSAQTVIDLMSALWPRSDPDPDWWQTPLGRVCARSFGRDDAEAVSHSVAAAMLGLHPKSIGQEINRGRLDRHPDGGVLRSSVLARLAKAGG